MYKVKARRSETVIQEAVSYSINTVKISLSEEKIYVHGEWRDENDRFVAHSHARVPIEEFEGTDFHKRVEELFLEASIVND